MEQDDGDEDEEAEIHRLSVLKREKETWRKALSLG